ncbi:MAG: CPBP family glutamic-type intramembrane protease [Nitrosopumilus sp.]|nr:CPBP family glutamic-type intramembrane protease [Nitrosopumilus sp.]MDH3516043.1 CPBP family glutamic-type intramembrane protease [Nitrosopumilus sp.]MDH3564530.1 CPBP family glutamic-type intramembrane protease [Nitrosopumilus sp.]MDH5417401.1 CPBP family glutamic-type intramembrane protease [Nitrosopumilus sp.]MDH5554727.1 CPBP family glutamic-type intramembrane protease [Nitrosopumilus sp.]
MQNSNKIFQFIAIPFTTFLSLIFGLLLISFPIGIYVFFESEIGEDINFEYPLTHLVLFKDTVFYQSSTDVSIGDIFVILWVFYLVFFVIALLGPRHGFLKTMSLMISFGKYDDRSNYMIGVTKWLSILVLVSILINFVQEQFEISIVPPMAENDLIQFFYVSLAPIIEEFGFRLILLGIPLFVFYSTKFSLRYFLSCLWTPNILNIHNGKKAIFLIIFVGVLFGFAHIAFGESWSEGKFVQASVSGIILGWVYLKYGFVASLLIHWATNYFIFAYATFLSQINFISIEEAFSHSLMSYLEILLLMSGMLSLSIMFLYKLYSKNFV